MKIGCGLSLLKHFQMLLAFQFYDINKFTFGFLTFKWNPLWWSLYVQNQPKLAAFPIRIVQCFTTTHYFITMNLLVQKPSRTLNTN